MNIPATLISWYQLNKRELPWRSTRDPYKIWLSEIILQQTRVNQGMDYYFRFVEKFPDVQSLAEASEEEVLKLWQGLGYYSRARNLHHTARTIVNEYKGVFPKSYEGLLKLKGVGEYTAAAIASISFAEVVPVVDGNVARVLSRLFAIDETVDSLAGNRLLKKISSELIPAADPANYNQAIMEFGALKCRPLNPDCETCPLRLECRSLGKKLVLEYPKKQSRTRVKKVHYYYLVTTFQVEGEEHVLLHKREGSGIWKNLYDFPLIEAESALDISQVLASGYSVELSGKFIPDAVSVSSEYIHQLSHRRIVARFIRIQLSGEPLNTGVYLPVPVSAFGKYPIPRLIDRYVETEGISTLKGR